VLINKCDLLADGEWQELEKQIFRRHPAVEVLATSLVTGMGLEKVNLKFALSLISSELHL